MIIIYYELIIKNMYIYTRTNASRYISCHYFEIFPTNSTNSIGFETLIWPLLHYTIAVV